VLKCLAKNSQKHFVLDFMLEMEQNSVLILTRTLFAGAEPMKRACSILACFILILSSTSSCSTDASGKCPWLGIHILMTTSDQTEQLTDAVKDLGQLGVNTIVAEINYGYEYQSHPNLRSTNASSREQLKELLAQCRKNNIRLIPQFQCLGHQSWKGTTFPLLIQYPQFDETPGEYPNNEGIYCRSWCPLHPEVNPIIFDLVDEQGNVHKRIQNRNNQQHQELHKNTVRAHLAEDRYGLYRQL
jgi:hypothetical protein